jgi:hypothetical protein
VLGGVSFSLEATRRRDGRSHGDSSPAYSAAVATGLVAGIGDIASRPFRLEIEETIGATTKKIIKNEVFLSKGCN